MAAEKNEPSEEPKLIGLAPLYSGSAIALFFGLMALGLAGSEAFFGTVDIEQSVDGDTAAIMLTFDDAPGAVRLVDQDQMADPFIEKMNLTSAEKKRLKTEVEHGRMRIGQIVVWDTVAEDTDTVSLNSAGYSQVVEIRHAEQVFFLPVIPGAGTRITATRDGGAGVTLGVRTIIGPVALPRLVVGQSVEIPVL